MRRVAAVAAIIVIAVLAVAWTRSGRDHSPVSGTTAAIAPFDMTIRHGETLPVERWRDPF